MGRGTLKSYINLHLPVCLLPGWVGRGQAHRGPCPIHAQGTNGAPAHPPKDYRVQEPGTPGCRAWGAGVAGGWGAVVPYT